MPEGKYVSRGGNFDVLTDEGVALVERQMRDEGIACPTCGGRLHPVNFDGPSLFCESGPKGADFYRRELQHNIAAPGEDPWVIEVDSDWTPRVVLNSRTERPAPTIPR